MSDELKGWARPRPLRVAFVIQDGENANLTLDGVFADCYSRWGGRFSLIVPAAKGRIAASYWAWLEAYDPDIVYSYVPLSRADVLEVHERLCPAVYRFHEPPHSPRRDAFDYKPSYDLTPLSSLSVIFRLARYNPAIAGATRIQIIDSWHTERPSRALTDNFGTYHLSQGGSLYPRDAMAEANLLTIVSAGARAVPRELITVESELHAFREFADRRATSLSIMSSLFTPRLEIRNRYSTSFNLVIGDSFQDRILFWNVRLLIPAWLDHDICTMRVDMNLLREADFLAVLGDTLKNRNHVNAGTGGQPQLTIRSCSLNMEELKEAHKLILSTKAWGFVGIETVAGLDDVLPSGRELQSARESAVFAGAFFARPDWKRFIWTPPVARPPATIPDHLSDAPIQQAFTTGFWSTEFLLEYDRLGPYLSEQNMWVLPRRWRMAGAFKIAYAVEPRHGGWHLARRSRTGELASFVSFDHPIEAIEVPTAYRAIVHALAIDGERVARDAEGEDAYPPNKVAWTDPSNEARYLVGVLGMTGGADKAANFLLHPFLQSIFSRLGGTPHLNRDAATPTVNRLQKMRRDRAVFNLQEERERSALGELIVKAARALKRPAEFVRYEDLKTSWKAYREAYWAAQNHLGDRDVDWDAREEASLEACLIAMRSAQMVFQGHSWTCQKCHHTNWVNLDGLSSRLGCEVCHQPTQMPVNIDWLFRPNEFLIESLRDHSVLSLIWVLSALSVRARRSLIFIEPTRFGFDPASQKTGGEADLLVLLDGKALVCEVKSSWRALRTSDISDFVALASRLRPDCALLGVMEAGPP
jgi:hypothetical protein